MNIENKGNSSTAHNGGYQGKVVLAYSGGLDTSIAIKWLKETYGLDVVAAIVDVGQPKKEYDVAVKKAKDLGALQTYNIDVKEEFVTEYVFSALKANAMYEGAYPLATAIARPLIAKKLVEVAEKEDAGYIAHGCTAKGNDQVRFEVSIAALSPTMEIIATAREWKISREDAIAYAKKHNIPIPITKKNPYSIDENLWGRSAECGVLEDPSLEPPDDVYEWTCSPLNAPDKPLYLDISFEKGIPKAVDGKHLDPVALVEKINKLGGEHGIGRIDHIESRLVGIKSHEIYEAPAAEILIKAHKDLENLTLTREQIHYKHLIEQKYAEMVYYGLWHDPLTDALNAFIDKTQESVTGHVSVKLFKGSAVVASRTSPYSLYDEGLATYEKGDTFDHDAAKGFIALWGLPVKVARMSSNKIFTFHKQQKILGETDDE